MPGMFTPGMFIAGMPARSLDGHRVNTTERDGTFQSRKGKKWMPSKVDVSHDDTNSLQ